MNVINYGLAVGAMAQGALLAPLKPPFPGWPIVIWMMVPLVVIHVITFTRVPPPIGLRATRMCFVISMCWYLVDTIVVESLIILGIAPPPPNPIVDAIMQVLMLGAMATFIPFWYAVRTLRRIERDAALQSTAKGASANMEE